MYFTKGSEEIRPDGLQVGGYWTNGHSIFQNEGSSETVLRSLGGVILGGDL